MNYKNTTLEKHTENLKEGKHDTRNSLGLGNRCSNGGHGETVTMYTHQGSSQKIFSAGGVSRLMLISKPMLTAKGLGYKGQM